MRESSRPTKKLNLARSSRVRMPELAWHAAWFIASIGVQLGFHINVGTEFVPNTQLDPLIERLASTFDERVVNQLYKLYSCILAV